MSKVGFVSEASCYLSLEEGQSRRKCTCIVSMNSCDIWIWNDILRGLQDSFWWAALNNISAGAWVNIMGCLVHTYHAITSISGSTFQGIIILPRYTTLSSAPFKFISSIRCLAIACDEGSILSYLHDRFLDVRHVLELNPNQVCSPGRMSQVFLGVSCLLASPCSSQAPVTLPVSCFCRWFSWLLERERERGREREREREREKEREREREILSLVCWWCNIPYNFLYPRIRSGVPETIIWK